MSGPAALGGDSAAMCGNGGVNSGMPDSETYHTATGSLGTASDASPEQEQASKAKTRAVAAEAAPPSLRRKPRKRQQQAAPPPAKRPRLGTAAERRHWLQQEQAAINALFESSSEEDEQAQAGGGPPPPARSAKGARGGGGPAQAGDAARHAEASAAEAGGGKLTRAAVAELFDAWIRVSDGLFSWISFLCKAAWLCMSMCQHGTSALSAFCMSMPPPAPAAHLPSRLRRPSRRSRPAAGRPLPGHPRCEGAREAWH